IVRVERLFEPGKPKFVELFGAADGRGGVPAQPGIDHQLAPADAPTGGTHLRQIAGLAFAHGAPAKLDRLEALVHEPLADLSGLRGRRPKKDGREGLELLAEGAAEELVDRPAERFARDVPQRDLDPAQRLDSGPLPAVIDTALDHALDEPVDL